MPNSHDPQVDLDRITSTLRTRYWCWTVLDPAAGPRSLLGLLRQMLPHIPEESWAERFDFGGVYVNGREALADAELPVPCKVEYYEPKFPIRDAAALFPAFERRFVVHEDDALAVVFKPPRLSSMPAKEQRHFSLKASLDSLFGSPVHMPSRLDVSAQGLLVVSKIPLAHARLQQAFESREVDKAYVLATAASVPWQARSVDLPIGRDPRHPVLRSTSAAAGQHALTHFSRGHAASSGGTPITLVHARPITGRTHQIRVHAASQGIPIFGDNFYGGASAPCLHLVSFSISLSHPVTGHRLHVVLPEALRPDWLSAASL